MARKRSKKQARREAPAIPWMTGETRGFLLLASAIFLLLSSLSFAIAPTSHNLLGMMGYTFGWALHALLGLSSYWVIVYIGWIGWRFLFDKPVHFIWLKHLYVLSAVISWSFLLTLIDSDFPQLATALGERLYPGLWGHGLRYHLGGAPFFYLYKDLPSLNLHRILNQVGVALIFSSLFIASVFFLFKIRLGPFCQAILTSIKQGIAQRRAVSADSIPLTPATKLESKRATAGEEVIENEGGESAFLRFVKLRIPSSSSPDKPPLALPSPDLLAIHPEKHLRERPSLSRKGQEEEGEGGVMREAIPSPIPDSTQKVKKRSNEGMGRMSIPQNMQGDLSQYALPSVSTLTNAKKGDQTSIKKDLKRQAEVLEETLLSFGIEAKVGQINCGPTITSFEVHPAIGVKVQRIKTLDNDIALNMEAKSIRIIAPIPGKAAVGIEVPNAHPQEVGFKDMLLAYQQGGQKFHIPILLGQAVNGDYVMSDLAKMPHCIIAGATGSGKSVCINTIIMSILFTARPDQIRLLMVDPKKVELTPYTHLPHMLAPVITESHEAAAALNWLVKEMEQRYELLKLVGVRNIDSFNQRTIDAERELNLGRPIPSTLPYIVGIIDELADLMMVASQDIETPIARIAQMARAVGIHLILATQRPSREVITGLIKANFPTRIAFKVASRVNSQIILDEPGAETLLGNGDLLFLPPGTSHLLRAQGAFIRDEDIQTAVRAICQQAPPNYVIQSFDRMHLAEGLDEGEEGGEVDALYEQAKDIVLSTGNASTTFLQRKLKVGYARAASLMDQLELRGIVGPAEGSRPRKVFTRGGEDDLEDQESEEE